MNTPEIEVDSDDSDASIHNEPVAIVETREERQRRNIQGITNALGLVPVRRNNKRNEAPLLRIARRLVDTGELEMSDSQMNGNMTEYSDVVKKMEVGAPTRGIMNSMKGNEELTKSLNEPFHRHPGHFPYVMPPNLIPCGLAPVNSKSRKRSDVKSSSHKISQDSSDQSRIVNLSQPGTSTSDTQETGDFNSEWDEYQLEKEECLYNMEGVPDFHVREPTPNIESMVAPKRKIFAEEKSATCESRNVASEENRTTQNVTVHSDIEYEDSTPEQQLEEIEELQPFPLYGGEQASDDQEDEKKLGDEQMMLPDYEHIVENQYTEKLMSKKRTKSAHCECHENGKDCSSKATCTNMGMMTECPSTCKAEGCRNQRIQRREYAELAIKFISEEVGHGVITLKPIRRGQFVIEYVGEVTKIGDEKKATNDTRHRYFFDSESHRIDATRKGNISRFINHHCSPNLECHKWSVPGTPDNLQRLVFFAKNDIEAGKEINFDYQFNNDDAETRQECHCDSDNCKKIIGRVPAELLPEDIVTIGETISDKEFEEELAKLRQMSNPERKRELIKQLISEFTIRNEAHIPSIIKIAHEMEDANQRRKLLKEIFSLETRGQTQKLYAPQVAELMKKWVRVQDSSSRNVKLVHEILTIFFQNKKKMFEFGDGDRSVLIGWLKSAAPNESNNETKKLIEVRKMADTLNWRWFSGSNRIPKKPKPTLDGSAPAVGGQCRNGLNIPAKSPEVLGSRRQHRSRSHSSRRSRSQSPPTPRSPSPFSEEAKKLESMIRSVREQNYSRQRRGNGPYEEREIRRVYRNWSSSRRCSPIHRRSRSRSPIVRRKEFDECRNGSRPESSVSHGTDPRRKRSYAEQVSNSQHHYLPRYQNGKRHNYRRFPSSNRSRSPSPPSTRSPSPFSREAHRCRSHSSRRSRSRSPPTPRSPSPFSPEARQLEYINRSVREQNYSRQRRANGPYEEREIRRVYRNWSSSRRRSPIRRRSRSRSPIVRRREFDECRNGNRPALQGMKAVERSKDGVSRKSTSNDLKTVDDVDVDEDRPEASITKSSNHPEKLTPPGESGSGRQLQDKSDEGCFLRLENPADNCSVNVIVNMLYCIQPFRRRLLENRETLDGISRLLADLFSRNTQSTTELRQKLRENLRRDIVDINAVFNDLVEKLIKSGEKGKEFRTSVNRNAICLTRDCKGGAGDDSSEEHSTTMIMPETKTNFTNMINNSLSWMSDCGACGKKGFKRIIRRVVSTSDYHFINVEGSENRKLGDCMMADETVEMHGKKWQLVAFAEFKYAHYKTWMKAKKTWICISDLKVRKEVPHNEMDLKNYGSNLMLFKKVD